jgi:hypothetical protein
VVFLRNRSTTYHMCFVVVSYWRKKWEYNETVYQLFVDFKKAHDPVRSEVLYSVLIEFGVPMKLVRTNKVCLSKTYIRVRIGK